MKKLRRLDSLNPLVNLPDRTLEEVLDGLFPTDRIEATGSRPTVSPGDRDEEDTEWRITSEELSRAIRHVAGKNTAPGPDGIPGRVLTITYGLAPDWSRECYDACLEEGVFPKIWKLARLVLPRKGDKPQGTLRPTGQFTSWT